MSTKSMMPTTTIAALGMVTLLALAQGAISGAGAPHGRVTSTMPDMAIAGPAAAARGLRAGTGPAVDPGSISYIRSAP